MTATDPNATAAFTDDTIGRTDRGALLCCHEPSYRDYLATALRDLGFKVHGATGAEVALHRLTSRSYPVVILLENLEGCSDLAQNAVWQHLNNLPTDERRETFVTLLGQSFDTGDPMMAYALSMDLLVRYQDVTQLVALLAPAMEEHADGDRNFRTVMQEIR